MSEQESKKERKNDDDRASEKSDQALDREIKAGEWRRLREFASYRRRTRQGRIIATHQAISNRIVQLEKLFYELVRNHPQKAEKLLAEIKRLRFLKEYLLQALIWEEQEEFDNHNTPEELEEYL